MTGFHYRPAPRPGDVATSHEVTVPVAGEKALTLTCRWPQGRTPKGHVVFCHGLGGSGEYYAELSAFWAQHGYLVIHPTFPDSIRAVAEAEPELGLDPKDVDVMGWVARPEIRQRMHEILHSPDWWLKRLQVLGQMTDRLDSVFAQTIGDSQTAGQGAIAGHSFGAYLAQLAAGAEIDLPGQGARSFRDDRFAAAILLSAQGRDQQGLRQGSWNEMTAPVLTVTGTRDQGAGGQGWKWKSEPYTLAPPGDKYLAVLDDGDHYLGGIASVQGMAEVPAQLAAVKDMTLAFLDAHLTGDQAALSWLLSISDHIGDAPVLFERK